MKILYMYSRGMSSSNIVDVKRGVLPSDSMYGYIELKNLGFDIDCFIDNNGSLFSKLIKKINKYTGMSFKSISDIQAVKNYDILVYKGNISTMLTLACKYYGLKIVYIDAIFRLPRNKIKKIVYKINLKLADSFVVFSKHQINTWSSEFNISVDKFKHINYSIDCSFYKNDRRIKKEVDPYILTVGRDIARDYDIFLEAVDGLDINIKIVALKSFFANKVVSASSVQLFEHISYSELFSLYEDALLVVIPLKEWGVIYPSGIRAMLEAMIFKKPIVATSSPVLKEYYRPDTQVIYVEPGSSKMLREKIDMLIGSQDFRKKLVENSNCLVENRYSMENFGKELALHLSEL